MARKKKKDPTATPGNPHGSHIEFGADQLRDALSLLRPVMYRRAIRKDYASYHIAAQPGAEKVTISVVGQFARLQVALTPMALVGTGTVMIDAHATNMLLDAWPEPRIRVHLGMAKPGEVELSWFQSKVTVNAFDPSKELKETAEPSLARSGFFIEARELVRVIQRSKFAVDEDSTRYALGGLFFDMTEPGRFTIVATDGRRLVKMMIPVTAHGEPVTHATPPREFKGYTDGVPVVPIRAMNIVEKLARREGVSRVGFSILPGDPIDLEKEKFAPARLQFVTPEAVVTCKVVEGRFPLYKDVFPAGPPACEARLDNADRLLSLLALATAASGTESRGVEMTMAGGCIMLSSESEHKAKAQLSLTRVEMDGQCTVTLDALWFRQMLDAIGSDPVTIRWFGPKDAILLSSGLYWEAAIMPLTRDVPEPPAPTPVEEMKEIEGNPDDFDPYGPQGDEGGDDGGNVPVEPTEPEPPVPVATEPETVKANGHAKPSKNGRRKSK